MRNPWRIYKQWHDRKWFAWWGHRRKKGKLKFIVGFGLTFGIFMLIWNSFVQLIINPYSRQMMFTREYLLGGIWKIILIDVGFGLLFAAFIWIMNQRTYQKKLEENVSPTSWNGNDVQSGAKPNNSFNASGD
jgi:hypothetical protein